MSVGVMGGGATQRGAGEGCGSLPRDGEGHMVTGVCGRDRWLAVAQVVDPGRVLCLPRPAHTLGGDRLGRIVPDHLF